LPDQLAHGREAAVASRTERRVREDARVIGLVGVAHAFSHFYQLALPPLFPLIHAQAGYTYAELGLLVTVLYTVSGVLQPLAGVVVDRIGTRRVLYGGLALMSAATALCGLLPAYPALLAAVTLAGVGNAVFHPSDYTILSHNVSSARVGRGFGFHAFAGYVGYAVAPVAMVALASALGWRHALVVAGAAGLVFLALLATFGHGVTEVVPRRDPGGSRARSPGAGLRPLMRVVILACFLFFCLTAMAQIALQSFTPAALLALHAMPITVSNTAVTAFLAAVTVGILAGGVLADRTAHHRRLAVAGLAPATVIATLPALVALPPAVLVIAFALMGASFGLLIPARDMLVRSAAPAHASGKVFGFVYSGLDVGAALVPFAIGWLLDHGQPAWTFLSAGACYGLAMVTMALSAVHARAR